MNENVVKLGEAVAGIVGGLLGWMVMYFDTHPFAGQALVVLASTAAFFVAVYAAWKIVSWTYRKVMFTAFGIRMRWYAFLKRLNKNRVFRSLKGKFMAKWKASYMADRFEDLIFEEQMSGKLSDQEARLMSKKIGKALGLTDLLPRHKLGKKLRYYFLGGVGKKGKPFPPEYQKLAGPRQPIPGGHPSQDVKPSNVVQSAMLAKLRKEKTAA